MSKKSICQSCGMPIEKESDFGTNADKTKNKEYCHYCFKNGRFTDCDVTMEQKIEDLISAAVAKLNLPEEKARQMAEEIIPNLKRWNNICRRP